MTRRSDLFKRLLIDIGPDDMVEIEGHIDIVNVLEKREERFGFFEADSVTVRVLVFDFLNKSQSSTLSTTALYKVYNHVTSQEITLRSFGRKSYDAILDILR